MLFSFVSGLQSAVFGVFLSEKCPTFGSNIGC